MFQDTEFKCARQARIYSMSSATKRQRLANAAARVDDADANPRPKSALRKRADGGGTALSDTQHLLGGVGAATAAKLRSSTGANQHLVRNQWLNHSNRPNRCPGPL